MPSFQPKHSTPGVKRVVNGRADVIEADADVIGADIFATEELKFACNETLLIEQTRLLRNFNS